MFSNGEREECVLSIGIEDWDLIGNHPNELKVLLFAPCSPTIGGSAPPANIPVPEAALKCPRCESTNIKSCYYSNYVLSQPRNFCKMCRWYWTQGVALRYVPARGIWRQNRRSNSPESRDNQTNFGPTATISSTICAARMLDSFMSPLSQITDNFPTYAGFQQQMNLNLKGEGVDDQGSTSYGGFDYHQPTSSTHHGSDAQGSTSYGGFQPPMNLNSTHHGPDAEPSTSRGGFDQQWLTEQLYVIDISIPNQILHQQWKDYIVIKKKIPVGSRELSDPVIHIVTQVASAALSYSIGGSSGTKHTVFATSLVGFRFTFAGIGMRSANPKLASVATKIGAVTSASAVIVGLAATLPAILAWPAGIVAGMGVLAAVAFS